jgi:hypothetical protein
MMEGLAPTSQLRLEPGTGLEASRQMVEVQLHLVQDGDSNGLQVLTLNTRLASRIEPMDGGSAFRMATARAAAARFRETQTGDLSGAVPATD